ncbi:hypothetical protein HDU99_002947 [Rhizoclosmatium hyalinum]|nr:hypothetical protein HDU99_002947 [Rhizoclosmatium hyalinum]
MNRVRISSKLLFTLSRLPRTCPTRIHEFNAVLQVAGLQRYPLIELTSRSFSTPRTCSGCGAPFHQSTPATPGFISGKLVNPPKPPPSVHKLPSAVPTSHLDSNKELAEGLTPRELKALLQKEKDEKPQVVCQYCHDLKAYNKTSLPPRPDTAKMLQRHLRSIPNNISVLVIDSADIPGSMLSNEIPELRNSKAVIVALNKIDLLKNIKGDVNSGISKLVKWVQKKVEKDISLLETSQPESDSDSPIVPKPTTVEVIPISSKTGDGVLNLIDSITKHRVFHPTSDVTLIGRPNAGKSRLINAITALGNGETPNHKNTDSIYPGTTVGVVSRPLSSFGILFNFHLKLIDSLPPGTPRQMYSNVIGNLYDTPGLFSPNLAQITELLTPQELSKAVTKAPFNPRKAIPLIPGKSCFLGALARIDYISGFKNTKIGIVPFMHDQVPIHVCRSKRVEELWENAGEYPDILFPPLKKNRVDLLAPTGMHLITRIDMTKTAQWKQKKLFDVAVGGIGWVRVENVPDDGVVEVWGLVKGSSVVVRDPFFTGE